MCVGDAKMVRPPDDPRTAGERVTRRVIAVVALGFALRLLIAPWTASVIDDAVWYRAAANGMHGVGIYDRLQFSYPPVWGYLLQGVGWVMLHLGFHPGSLATTDQRLVPAIVATNAFSTTVTTPSLPSPTSSS